jgi:nucleotidyltransferase substrate binding protein (TIGR01987 family)
MKDYFEYQGNTLITGSRDAMREAFQRNLISDGDQWMAMIKSRNMSFHTYHQKIADEIGEQMVGTSGWRIFPPVSAI